MEITLTPDERIRMAEEIYYKRRNQNLDRSSVRIREEEKPNSGDVKKDDTKKEDIKNNTQQVEQGKKKPSKKILTKTGSVGTTVVAAIGMGLVLVGVLVIKKRQRN